MAAAAVTPNPISAQQVQGAVANATQGQNQPDQADPSPDIPVKGTEEQLVAAAGLTEQMKQDLITCRRMHKEANVSKRQVLVRRLLRAFEVLKNNSYIEYNEANADFDTLSTILSGVANGKDIDLYTSNHNVYGMLALSFIAALSPDVPKTRYQPLDADDEEDLMIAEKASIIQAYLERQNGIKALQKLELLYLWCAGSYFTYTRHVIDKNRGGIQRDPVIEMMDTEILPARYVCSHCGQTTPEAQLGAFGTPKCPDCGAPLSPSEWYPPENMPAPVKTGYKESPRGMTAMDIYSGLQVDVDPDAGELYESLHLDLEGEISIAWVRAQFPDLYDKIQPTGAGDGTTNQDAARRAREAVTSPGPIGSNGQQYNGTYSRCWMQPEAFNILPTKAQADALVAAFPDGVKLITYNTDTFLRAVPERMTDHWTWCGMLKGLGMYPMGVGDATLGIQEEINDTANNVHAYMDRMAFGTILADEDYINVDAMTTRPLIPGNFTGVKRRDDTDAPPVPLEQMLFQPEFHMDGEIFKYEQQLIMLAQLLSGVQPQTFGGSDPNVKTMGGQEQALKTAMGRLLLFWDQIREEHAKRSQNAVRCAVDNMDDVMKIVVKGEIEGDYRTEKILASELTGEFLAYAESDEGFPSSYEEIQARIMQLLSDQKSPFLAAVLSDPDTQKVVSRYILPDQIKLPGERMRTRVKMMLRQMQDEKPSVVPGPNGQPLIMPSLSLNAKFDDIAMAQTIIKSWLQENWEDSATPGFANILALLTQASQLVAQQQAAMALQVAAQQGPGGPPCGGAPAGPPPGAGSPPPGGPSPGP